MIKRDFTIIQGDDYAAADNRSLVFSGAGENWPDLSTATFALKARTIESDEAVAETLFSTTGTHSLVSGTQYIKVPLTSAHTSECPAGSNSVQYDLQATLSGRRITLAQGYFTVRGSPE